MTQLKGVHTCIRHSVHECTTRWLNSQNRTGSTLSLCSIYLHWECAVNPQIDSYRRCRYNCYMQPSETISFREMYADYELADTSVR